MRPKPLVVALAAAALLAAGCSGHSGESDHSDASASGAANATTSATAASGQFGDLSDVCQSGHPTSAPAQGVTAGEIHVGVFTDVGFTKDPSFVDAANAFTNWCNAAGGINGRKIVADIRDTKFMEVRQRMLESCREDFALVGGGAALDSLGVKDRLSCMLPDFPGQVAQATNTNADLQISASPSQTAGYNPYYGFRTWAIKEAYPDSANALGIINGDSPVTKNLGDQAVETAQAAGGTFAYNDLYPATGVADWTPYAQAIKNKGVKGLIFFGAQGQLAKLEGVLTSMDYKLDWIDANNNGYNSSFIDQLGKSADYQNNYVDLGGVAPVESSKTIPAMSQLHDIYKQYAPNGTVTLTGTRAFSSWLLFAKAASSCGDNMTRACVYDAAKKETAWTGGGLHATQNLAQPIPPSPCFNIEQAKPGGWEPADFHPDQGAYRCNIPAYKMTGNYGAPMTLADVGKSMNDLR